MLPLLYVTNTILTTIELHFWYSCYFYFYEREWFIFYVYNSVRIECFSAKYKWYSNISFLFNIS